MDRSYARRLFKTDDEIKRKLEIYVELIVRWRTKTNLISDATLNTIWSRHIADSVQLLELSPMARRWVDIGSGAGFPGIVLAILLHGASGSCVHVIESDRRKCAFLREVARATRAPAKIYCERVQSVSANLLGPVDAVTARGFAPLSDTLFVARPWLSRGVTGVFPCGRLDERKVQTLATLQDFDFQLFRSRLDTDARVVRVEAKVLSPRHESQTPLL